MSRIARIHAYLPDGRVNKVRFITCECAYVRLIRERAVLKKHYERA